MTGPVSTFDMAGQLIVVLNDFTVTADLTGAFSGSSGVIVLRRANPFCQIVDREYTAIGQT